MSCRTAALSLSLNVRSEVVSLRAATVPVTFWGTLSGGVFAEIRVSTAAVPFGVESLLRFCTFEQEERTPPSSMVTNILIGVDV